MNVSQGCGRQALIWILRCDLTVTSNDKQFRGSYSYHITVTDLKR